MDTTTELLKIHQAEINRRKHPALKNPKRNRLVKTLESAIRLSAAIDAQPPKPR